MNTFEQVLNDGHQMSPAGGAICLISTGGCGRGVPMSDVWGQGGVGRGLYSEFQCIMDNGHMVTPPMSRPSVISTRIYCVQSYNIAYQCRGTLKQK